MAYPGYELTKQKIRSVSFKLPRITTETYCNINTGEESVVFSSLAKKYGKKTSNRIFLGATEAEAEALPISKIPLSAVYDDHHHLLDALQNEKFIICGRKGAGKSAFAEYIYSIQHEEPNLFCKFIRQGEVNLEKIVQLGINSGHSIERETLYTWLILTNILKLFTDNQAINNCNEYNLLSLFLSKNSGYIDIREGEIKELIKKDGFDVNIEYFKRYLTSKHNKSIETKQVKAPFYKLIPHLKEVILKALKSKEELSNENSYVIFFDDLDITFNIDNADSESSIISLLRVSKEINNEFFAKNNINSKIVILLRDDIAKSISEHSSDTAKLFSSYSVSINWYQDEYNKNNHETNLNIRKFINKRISYAFKLQSMEFDKTDPWLSLVEDPFINQNNNEPYSRTSFKYVLEHTFFRPRDLILFFRPLQSHHYNLPLSKTDINQLIGTYCEEVTNELKNELSCFYSKDQIHNIFTALGEMSRLCKQNSNISNQQAIATIQKHCKDISATDLLGDFFNRSLIGNIGNNSYTFFKHREPSTDTYKFNPEYRITLHNAIKVYCSNKGYS